MKNRCIFPICVIFLLGIFGISYAEPFQNGSFESGPSNVGSYITLEPGSTDITGWIVDAGSIDLVGNYWEASDGNRSLDLNGNGPGAISQTFDTEAGAIYQVLFDMAGNPDGSGVKVLLVNANSRFKEFKFDSTEKSTVAMGWVEMGFFFRAVGDSTTLRFTSAGPDSPYGPALDNVRVRWIGQFPEDLIHPAGAVHAHDNLLWPPNNKMVPVTIEGYVFDELSIIRDGGGLGLSKAYLIVDGETIILRDEYTNVLDDNGNFRIVKELQAKKGAEYSIELWAADTNPAESGGPNENLVDSTYVRVPHDMSGKDKAKKNK